MVQGSKEKCTYRPIPHTPHFGFHALELSLFVLAQASSSVRTFMWASTNKDNWSAINFTRLASLILLMIISSPNPILSIDWLFVFNLQKKMRERERILRNIWDSKFSWSCLYKTIIINGVDTWRNSDVSFLVVCYRVQTTWLTSSVSDNIVCICRE